jgi:hypothetical protein
MQNTEPEREQERQKDNERQTYAAYQSVRYRLQNIREAEQYHDKAARKRTGITQPAHLYRRPRTEIDPQFAFAMQRLWGIGTLDKEGRADTDLRRVYHLVAKGRAPLTEADVIELGQMPEERLRPLLGWCAHRLSLAEAMERVNLGSAAPSVTTIEELHE